MDLSIPEARHRGVDENVIKNSRQLPSQHAARVPQLLGIATVTPLS